jgi:hypothetical protein
MNLTSHLQLFLLLVVKPVCITLSVVVVEGSNKINFKTPPIYERGGREGLTLCSGVAHKKKCVKKFYGMKR